MGADVGAGAGKGGVGQSVGPCRLPTEVTLAPFPVPAPAPAPVPVPAPIDISSPCLPCCARNSPSKAAMCASATATWALYTCSRSVCVCVGCVGEAQAQGQGWLGG